MIPNTIDSLEVKVKPHSRKNEVLEYSNGKATIAIAANPDKGLANQELEKFLTKLTGRKANIKSGFTSKRKLVIFDKAV